MWHNRTLSDYDTVMVLICYILFLGAVGVDPDYYYLGILGGEQVIIWMYSMGGGILLVMGSCCIGDISQLIPR